MKIKYFLATLICFAAFTGFSQTTTVSGSIVNFMDEPITNFEVILSIGSSNWSTVTNAAGEFQFDNVPVTDEPVQINPNQSVNPFNGVSTFDVVMGLRHILGKSLFDRPDQYIAMDVNKSGTITLLDLLYLRQLIVGIIVEFPNNSSWRLIEKKQFDTLEIVNRVEADYIDNFSNSFSLQAEVPLIIDFLAVKIGDANGTALNNN